MKDAEDGKHQDDELAHARELLARTVRFLAHCAEDPQAALKAEDPRELMHGLQSLSLARPEEPDDRTADEPAAEPRTIQIRRRRSA